MHYTRKFYIEKPTFVPEDINNLAFIHDGKHLELYYNLIFANEGLFLPDHLRPICWALGDKSIDRLMVIISPGSGKSQLTDIAFPTWELGLDRNSTVIATSAGEGLVRDFLQASMTIIEGKFYKELYPKSIPDKSLGWSKTTGIFLKREVSVASPSYVVAGYGSRTLTGKHASIIIGDDIHDELNCYSDDTEVLTKRGWLLFKDVKDTDLIATRNKNCQFEWQYPTHITIADYKGDELIHFNSRGLDLLVTPNHRMLVSTRGFGEERIIKADELEKTSNRTIPVTSIWNGEEIKQFQLLPNENDGLKIIKWTGDQYCAFMGMYLSEGNVYNRSVTITQSESSKGFIPFKTLITEIDNKPAYHTGREFVLHSTLLKNYLSQFGFATQKYIPDLIKNATSRQIEIFLHYFFLGDGTTRYSKLRSFSTSSKRLADDLQELIQKIGYNSYIRKHKNPEKIIICGKEVKSHSEYQYIVSQHYSRFSNLPKNYVEVRKSQRIKYINRKVYCVTVPNEIIYVRRNGHAAWCGNTMTGDQLDKVENWYYRTLLGRQNPSGSRIILIGRRWDSADLYGRLKDSGDWLVMTLSNFQEEGETEVGFEVVIPANLGCVFNEFTPSPKEEWVKVIYGTDPNGFFWTKTSDDDVIGSGKYKEAVQIRKNKPDLFQIVYQSRPEETSTAIFRDTDFAYYKPPENVNHGRESRDVCEFLKDFDYVIQTWDTAFTAQSSSDPSVCYTLGLRPCNETHIEIPDLKDTPDDEAQKIPFHFDIYILDEYYAQLDFADLLPESVRLFNLWQPNTVVIEYSALGIPLCRSLEQYNIPVEGIKINNISKRTRAISGAKAGSAQGWFRQHRVLFPGDPNIEWVEPAKKELKDFTGAHNGKDDRVDALVQGINYAIDLGIQYRDLPQGWRSDREIINKVSTWTKQLTPLEAIVFNVTQNINNPFYGLCGTCKHFVSLQPNNPNNKTFCDVNKITVSAIHSCSFYIPTEENQLSIDLTHS